MDEIKKQLESIQNDLALKATNEKIDELLGEIKRRDQKISDLEERVSVLEGDLKLQKIINNRLETLIDDQEQYQRRTSLRIWGIPQTHDEKSSDCLNLAQAEIEKLGAKIPVNCLDRAHRVGKVKQDDKGKDLPRAIIVKFKSWTSRTEVYQKRPKKKGKDTKGGVRFNLDLTKRRLKLKFKAIDATKDMEVVDFVFADVNCSIGMRLKSGKFLFFNSDYELDEILKKL